MLNSFRFFTAGAQEAIVVGPLWEGVVLRGVELVYSSRSLSSILTLGFVLSDSSVLSVAAANLSESLLDSPERVLLGFEVPGMTIDVLANTAFRLRLAVYREILGGPKWVGVIGSTNNGSISMLVSLIIEPERLVRPSLDRGPAARRLRSNGEVLEGLRREALAAQDLGSEVESGVR